MICGYTGLFGGGKTLNMVRDAYHEKQRGRAVYANIPLPDWRIRRTRQYWFFGAYSVQPMCERTYGQSWADGYVEKLEDVLKLDNALVLLDEVHMWMHATEWRNVSFEVRRFIAQQRKFGVDLWWTAQRAAGVFNEMRELTTMIYECRRYGTLSLLDVVDPIAKARMGRKWRMIGPQYWELFESEFYVGNATGTQAGEKGHNARYDHFREAALRDRRAIERARQGMPPQAHETPLSRIEDLGGRVCYVLQP